jgi:WS/DGAT C-terminal domain/Wax ester synthase-like Acyl-CoA acyltransferase domain
MARQRPGRERLHPADALFLAVDTPEVPQQIGAVVVIEPGARGPLTIGDVADLARGLPRLRGRLDRGGPLTRAAWWPDPSIDVADLVDSIELAPTTGDTGDDAGGAAEGDRDATALRLRTTVDAFFSVPLDPTTAPGRFRLVSGLPNGRQAILLVVHHAVCDGVQLTLALVRRAHGTGLPEAAPRGAAGGRAPTSTSSRLRNRAAKASLGVKGLCSLAVAGRAPRTPIRARVPSPRRRHALVDLPAQDLRRAARGAGVSTTELVVGLVAQALHEAVPDVAVAGSSTQRTIRVIVPRALTGTSRSGPSRTAGNLAGALRVDLPVGPMTAGERVAAVSAAMRKQLRSGQPQAARWVVNAIGTLPGGPQRVAARLVYRSTWFSGIVTVIPGLRSSVQIAGRPVGAVYPVLPLATGVNLSVGAIPRGDVVSVCITTGPSLAGRADALAEGLRKALVTLSPSAVPH